MKSACSHCIDDVDIDAYGVHISSSRPTDNSIIDKGKVMLIYRNGDSIQWHALRGKPVKTGDDIT